MKPLRSPHLFMALALLLALPQAAQAEDLVLEARQQDLVQTATADARFTTLAKALAAADLIDTLRGKGPFTVFAPTNAAFAKLPEGTLAGLLAPEAKDRLRAILLAHVVQGRVGASDLVPVGAVQTVGGARFPVGITIGGARVIQADIPAANGVIHVIDAVLVPASDAKAPAPTQAPPAKPVDAMAVIEAAVEKGAPLYNDGDPAACAAVYEAAAARLVAAPLSSLNDLARMELRATLAEKHDNASARAWALRDAFDRYAKDMAFTPRIEAPLPEGFPKPGPVGQVITKQYPAYRAARSEQSGRNGAFWRLFQHIKSNDVKMTAPVEMTMDDDMRAKDMAFLYEAPDQGTAGRQGRVDVVDLDRIEVLSIGMRGVQNDARVRMAKALVEARMNELGLQPAGEWRLMGYNSPMVPTERRYWELQIPVGR